MEVKSAQRDNSTGVFAVFFWEYFISFDSFSLSLMLISFAIISTLLNAFTMICLSKACFEASFKLVCAFNEASGLNTRFKNSELLGTVSVEFLMAWGSWEKPTRMFSLMRDRRRSEMSETHWLWIEEQRSKSLDRRIETWEFKWTIWVSLDAIRYFLDWNFERSSITNIILSVPMFDPRLT